MLKEIIFYIDVLIALNSKCEAYRLCSQAIKHGFNDEELLDQYYYLRWCIYGN